MTSKILFVNDNLPLNSNEGVYRKYVFTEVCKRIFSGVSFGNPPALIDVGAGPCIFSKIAHDIGYDVTALDGRKDRVPTEIAFRFVNSNLLDFSYQDYNVVVLLGVLYHLTLSDQIKFLNSIPEDAIFICDTQVHIEALLQKYAWVDRNGDLPILEHQLGYEGVIFEESNNPMASLHNDQSFWHTELSLSALLDNTGFIGKYFINEPYLSKYGARRWFVASKSHKRTLQLDGCLSS